MSVARIVTYTREHKIELHRWVPLTQANADRMMARVDHLQKHPRIVKAWIRVRETIHAQ